MTPRIVSQPLFRKSLMTVAMLAAAFSFSPIVALADTEVHEDRADLRIQDMHQRLNIEAGQEQQWAAVATIMRDNAVTMDRLTQMRMDRAGEVSAVEDLKSYGDITDALADGIKKLTPAFSTLYASMSDGQKKQADLLFRQGGKASGGNEAPTSPASK